MPYYLSTTRAHIRRFEDGTFRDKWCGLWVQGKRILHYWAAKVENSWLAPENHAFFDGKHHYLINGNHWVEVEELGENGLELRVENAKDVTWELGVEPGQNIEIVGEIIGEKRDEHIQGEEKLPVRRVWIRGNPIIVRFRGGKSVSTRFVVVGNPLVEEVVNKAKDTILCLVREKGFYAGLPWFHQYWARDFLWSVPALLSLGFQKYVKKMILRLILNERNGEPPRLIHEDGRVEYGAIDTAPLLLLALRSYVIRTGDRSVLEWREELENIAYFLEDRFPNLLARSHGKDTWMDSRDDRSAAIEVQALWYAAARGCKELGIPTTEPEEIKKAFLENRGSFLIERSANVLVAGMYGLMTPREALNLAKEWKLISPHGIRSWSPHEIDYSPRGYHSGAVWGLTTNWGLIVSLLAGDFDLSRKLLEVMAKRGRYLDEIWDANTGEPIGADCQLWSASLLITAIVDYMIRKSLAPRSFRPLQAFLWERGNWRMIRV